MSDQYIVATAYEAAYPEPLAAPKGARLKVHRKESEWPGWVWCTAASGVGGWVPGAWVLSDNDRSCTLLRDYTARELTVASGDLVTGSLTESGWAWVTNATGHSGWVPLSHLVQK